MPRANRSGARKPRTRVCSFNHKENPPVGIVFDADLGNTIDDALALAMLFGFQGKNESRVISVSTTKSSLEAAVFADVLVRFYTGEPGPFAGAIPIGLCALRQDGRAERDARCRDRQCQSTPALSSR